LAEVVAVEIERQHLTAADDRPQPGEVVAKVRLVPPRRGMEPANREDRHRDGQHREAKRR